VKHANKMSHFLNKILEQIHTAIGNIWKYFMWYFKSYDITFV
jgi:hypothetical protein